MQHVPTYLFAVLRVLVYTGIPMQRGQTLHQQKKGMQSHGWHLAMVAMDQYGSFAKPIETTWT